MSGLAKTISQQASIIESVLQGVVQSQSGIASVVSSQEDLWNQPYQNNTSFRILVCFLGEKTKGTIPGPAILHRVNRNWQVRVTRGRGLSSNRGDSLTKTIGNALPFWDVMEQCRDAIRCIGNICPPDELPVDYDRTDMVKMKAENGIIDCGDVFFSAASDISALYTTPEGPEA